MKLKVSPDVFIRLAKAVQDTETGGPYSQYEVGYTILYEATPLLHDDCERIARRSEDEVQIIIIFGKGNYAEIEDE